MLNLEQKALEAEELVTLANTVIAADPVAGGIARVDANRNFSFEPLPPAVGPQNTLGATFDPVAGIVEIPLSVQSFDLGRDPFGDPVIINPGDRVHVGYQFSLYIKPLDGNEGFAGDGVFGGYSDPLQLSLNRAFTVQFQPASGGGSAVPEPSGLALLAIGSGLLGVPWRRESTRAARQHRAVPTVASSNTNRR